MCERAFGDVPTVVVEPGIRTGVPILIDNPKEVGADRVMNTLAAHHLYGGACVVVDFGTSTNYDAVSARGEFLGGALAPGIEISLDALAARAAQLRKVELTVPRSPIGKSTVEALQSGMIYGVAGQVDGLVRRFLDGTRAARRAPSRSSPPAVSRRWCCRSARRCSTTSRTSPCSGCGSSSRRTPERVTDSVPAVTGASGPRGPDETDDLPEQIRIRTEKLERLRAEGVDPYPVGLPAHHLAGRRPRAVRRPGRRCRAPGKRSGSPAGSC